MNELARELRDDKHFRWMFGMRALWRDVSFRLTGASWERDQLEGNFPRCPTYTLDIIPDLADPATVGCLVALGMEHAFSWHDFSERVGTDDHHWANGPNVARALLRMWRLQG